MAALPSQISGAHYSIYDEYWNQVDPNNSGIVGAINAARFLKRSGLSDVVLSRIWDLADPGGRGCLDKAGFFVALKLVSIAQAGIDLNMSNISKPTQPPKMGDGPKLPPVVSKPVIPPAPIISALPPTVGDWTIKPNERNKYDQLFDSLQPINGMIPGVKVKGVLMESKLPLETLGKIWDLADIDKDGMLDRHEFIVAMHLVYKALEKHAIPATLPPELMPPAKRVPPVMPPPPAMLQNAIPQKPPPPVSIPPQKNNVSLLMDSPPKTTIPATTIPWVVSAEEKIKFDRMFVTADVDKDGFVSGFEIKDVFLQSGVPQSILAQIWALCDIKQIGKLNSEQFALAMWMVNRKLQGIDPPNALEPNMVPPSFRDQVVAPTTDATLISKPTPYSNPELEMISKDIEELAKEKLLLETDIAQKEADIKIKNGEIKSLQNEHDTLTAAFKQLENQKGEAQKRLNDLKTQTVPVGSALDILSEIAVVQTEVEKLRTQATEQEETLKKQESEVNKKREALEGLRMEQQQLEKQRDEFNKKLEEISQKLATSQLQINTAKAKITQLQEQQRQMRDAINICDTAINTGDCSLVPDTCLKIEPEFRDPEFTKIVSSPPATSQNYDNNLTNQTDPFKNQNGHVTSGFSEDAFGSDNFKRDAFGNEDLFAGKTIGGNFNNQDPFSSSDNKNNNLSGKGDPFDPFGDKNRNTSASPFGDSEKDPFGCDPFAILHAPTRDGTIQSVSAAGSVVSSSVVTGRASPSPALPPKKGKTPPPRPAPPRPSTGPRIGGATSPASGFSLSSTTDSWGDNPKSDSFGFANFADFDSKFSNSMVQKNTFPTMPKMSKPTIINQQNVKETKLSKSHSNIKLEFSDDPFKDYRYEDVFNIADPFDDVNSDGFNSEGVTSDSDMKNNNVWDSNKSTKKSISTSNFDHIFNDDFDKDLASVTSFESSSVAAGTSFSGNGRMSVPLFNNNFSNKNNLNNNKNVF